MTDESVDKPAIEIPKPHHGFSMRGVPGWVTSFGAFCSLLVGGFNYSNHVGAQSDGEKRNQKAEENLLESQRRIWNAINEDRKSSIEDRKTDAAAREHLRDRLHDELLAEIHRELDYQRCVAQPRGACRDR